MVDRILSWGFNEFVETHCEIHALNVYLADQASFFPFVFTFMAFERPCALHVIKLSAGFFFFESFKKK